MLIHDIHNRMKLFEPDWTPQNEKYRSTVERYVNRDDALLDIGCGRSSFMRDIYSRANKVIGLDSDPQALGENQVVQIKLSGGLEKLDDVERSSIDIAVTSWVLEHINDVDQLFIQLNKVLKPGGLFISLTPNKKSMVTRLSMVLPNKTHPLLVKMIWGRAEKDTYPAYYKLNTVEEIQAYADKYGYLVESIELLKDPTYYAIRPRFLNFILKIYNRIVKPQNYEGILFILKKL